VGYSLWGGVAARDQGRLFFGFPDRCFRPCLLAVLAGICKINVFPDLHLGRDHYQSTAHLGPNLCHERTAFRTVTFRLRDAVLHHLNRDVLRQNLLHTGGPLLPGMSGNPGFPRGSSSGKQPCFRLIKHETELANHLFLRLLGGCPVDLLFGKTHLFHQPVQFLVQFVSFHFQRLIFRTGNGHHFRVACGHICCIFRVFIITEPPLKYQCFQEGFRKITSNFQCYIMLRPVTALCALDCSIFSPFISQRYCCGVSIFASTSDLGHWYAPCSSLL